MNQMQTYEEVNWTSLENKQENAQLWGWLTALGVPSPHLPRPTLGTPTQHTPPPGGGGSKGNCERNTPPSSQEQKQHTLLQ